MLFLFFSLTLVVLAWALLQGIRAARAARAGTSTADPGLCTVEKAVAIAVPVTVVILLFFLPASITRYEVFYPIYLLLIGLLPVPYTNHGALRPYLSATVAMLIAGQFLACIQYVAHNRKSTASPAARYDSVLNCIPATAKVAASPQLWLAFARHDRPFSLLYHGLDGLEAWKKTSADPLGRFDVILLTDYIQEDFDRYAGLSARGHIEHDVPIGPNLLHVYTRPGVLSACNDTQPQR